MQEKAAGKKRGLPLACLYLRPGLLAFVAVAVMMALPVDQADGQSYVGVLELDEIPPSVATESPVAFSGSLTTASGLVVEGATVYIKDDVDFGRDRIIATLTTDRAGQFSWTWIAQPRSSGAWDFYAVFDGGGNVGAARSQTETVMVSQSGYVQPSYDSSLLPASIVLDRIPSSIYAGESVTFTGYLVSNGRPLADKIVTIAEDDPLLPDQTLGYQRTDRNGEFAVTWAVGAGLVEDDFDVYAVFDGDATYQRARSHNQEMTVMKYGGMITLDPIPRSAKTGQVIEFSGTLNLDGHSTEGAIVYIKDEDTGNPDDLLATAYVDGNGRFFANWIVTEVDDDGVADIYAVFEGNNVLHRLTTCDPGPTRSFGGLCIGTVKLSISGQVYPTQPAVDPTSEHMQLLYSIPFMNAPHVAIVPSPDSYDDVKSHIVPVREGILMWKSELEQRHGGNWDITFEVIVPGGSFSSRPDVVVNLVTHEIDSSCYSDYAGVASISPNPKRPVQTIVCSTSAGMKMSNADVAATAAHEFIHAVGLGHTFNKRGDLMCSIEHDVPTCPTQLYSKSNMPSDLNLDAVAHIYGTDGFRVPNGYVKYREMFTNDAGPTSYGADIRPDVSQKPDHDCPDGGYSYDWRIDGEVLRPGWYLSYDICSVNDIHYSFSTDDASEGFLIYVLPPETDVEDFVNHGIGDYYTCEEYGTYWHVKSGSCNIEFGSSIVLDNDGPDTIRIVNGYIRN